MICVNKCDSGTKCFVKAEHFVLRLIIEIGNYRIPVDQNGNISGGLKVSSFRPYLGLGFGRAIPKKRIGFMFEMGVQFHNTPKVYTNNGDLSDLTAEADNDFTDIIDKLTVYPVLKFRLCGKIF